MCSYCQYLIIFCFFLFRMADTFSPTTQLLTAVFMYLATVPQILTLHTSMLSNTANERPPKHRDRVCCLLSFCFQLAFLCVLFVFNARDSCHLVYADLPQRYSLPRRIVYWLIDRKFMATDSFCAACSHSSSHTIEGRRLSDGTDPRTSLWKLIFEGTLFCCWFVVVVVVVVCFIL